MNVFRASTEQSYIEIYRFIFTPVKTNMYFILSKKEAIIIDPHESSEGYEFLSSNGINNIKIFLTHEHFDHTSGVNWFKDRFESELICHLKCAEQIEVACNNRPFLVAFVLSEKDKVDGGSKAKELLKSYKPYTCQADITFDAEMIYEWNGHKFYLKPTPGHTPGSCCITFDENIVFTGDYLIKGVPVITRFPGGSSEDYNCITIPYLKLLKNEMLIMLGHDDPFYKSEANIL